MSLFTSKNPAGVAGAELGLISIGLGNMLADAHASGMRNVEEGRARRCEYEYDCDLYAARVRADDLGREAIQASRKVAALEAEVRNLRVALQQRQAIITRMSKAHAA